MSSDRGDNGSSAEIQQFFEDAYFVTKKSSLDAPTHPAPPDSPPSLQRIPAGEENEEDDDEDEKEEEEEEEEEGEQAGERGPQVLVRQDSLAFNTGIRLSETYRIATSPPAMATYYSSSLFLEQGPTIDTKLLRSSYGDDDDSDDGDDLPLKQQVSSRSIERSQEISKDIHVQPSIETEKMPDEEDDDVPSFMRFKPREPSILRNSLESSPELQPVEAMFPRNGEEEEEEEVEEEEDEEEEEEDEEKEEEGEGPPYRDAERQSSLASVSQGLEDNFPKSRSQARSHPPERVYRDRQPAAVETLRLSSSQSKRSSPTRAAKKTRSRDDRRGSSHHRSPTTSVCRSESPPGDELQEGRSAQDRFLVEKRNEGLGYKEIKQLGGYAEAVSTLRGRYRMLTKDRSERVRKPEWTDLDISLLKQAVESFSGADNPAEVRLRWSNVSEWMHDHGATYKFGGATCHRKWRELQEDQLDEK